VRRVVVVQRTERQSLLQLVGCAALATGVVGCGPTDGSSGSTSERPDAGFTRTQRYPGYCRGVVHRDLDEVPDAVEFSTFDGEVLTRRSFDSDRDGDIDRRTKFTYGDEGRLVEQAVDEGVDGVVDEERLFEYEGERLVEERVDEQGDGAIDRVISYRHDEEGRRLRGEGRAPGSDEVELVLQFERTEGGRLDALRLDGIRGAPDEQVDQVFDYLYDTHGNRTEARFDFDANGRADIVVFYKYDCWRGRESSE